MAGAAGEGPPDRSETQPLPEPSQEEGGEGGQQAP